MSTLLRILFIILTFKSYSQTTVPFELTPEGHILVRAIFEGQEGNFIFDTGAGINVVFSDFAAKLKQKSSYNFFTAFRATGERIDAPLFSSDEIAFGGMLFRNVPYSTFDLKVNDIDGLISLQMFKDTDLIIDYINQELILGPINSLDKKSIDIHLATMADHALDIFTYIVLDNKYTIKVLLDSGAGNNSIWLSARFMELLACDENDFKVTEKKSEFNANKATKIYKGPIGSISNNFTAIHNPTVSFVEGLIYEGKTSINWLGNRIGISLREKKIYILD